jgi:hypothetical protein
LIFRRLSYGQRSADSIWWLHFIDALRGFVSYINLHLEEEAKVANELMGNEFMAVVGAINELNVSPEYNRTGKLGPENLTEAVLILQHAFSGTNVPFEVALKATDEKLSPLLGRLHGLFLDARLTNRSVRITYEQNPERAQQVTIRVTL